MSNESTPLLRNHAKEKLAKGEPVYSMTVRLVRSVDIASIAYTAGFDSIYIDMEHSTFPLTPPVRSAWRATTWASPRWSASPAWTRPSSVGSWTPALWELSCPESNPPTKHSPRFVPSSTRR